MQRAVQIDTVGAVRRRVDAVEVAGAQAVGIDRGAARDCLAYGTVAAACRLVQVTRERIQAGIAECRAVDFLVPCRILVHHVGQLVAFALVAFHVDEDVVAVFFQVAETGQQAHRRLLADAGIERLLVVGAGADALEALAGNDIDHAGQRIGTVDGRGAVLDHFDTLDHIGRNRIEVDKRFLATIGKSIVRDALAIDQHQRRALAQAAHGSARGAACKAARLAVVAQGAAIERGQRIEDLAHGIGAGGLDFVTAHDRDRRRRLGVHALDIGTGDFHALHGRLCDVLRVAARGDGAQCKKYCLAQGVQLGLLQVHFFTNLVSLFF